jgi:CRISPR-associated protein Cas2
MFYLVCYDIVSDRRRNKVSKLLEAYGLRVQKSVFECVLDDKQQEYLQKRLLQLLNKREDQIRFYPLSAHCRGKVVILGIQPTIAVDDAAFIV